jgi:NADH pyrophosphatase NudC (nudix superfamily)
MTPEEAITILKIAKTEVEWNYPLDYAVAIATAIEALEKQIPKKPISLGEDIDRDVGQCPNCKEIIDTYEDYKYCSDCGQAIDWRDEE